MKSYKSIIVIYNPNSTGDSERNAKAFAYEVEKRAGSELPVAVKATERAGHAEEIAAEHAASDVLLVSSSGDGGYNEVVNGVLKTNGAKAAVAVLPSGNANDHHAATVGDDQLANVIQGVTTDIDVLRIVTKVDGRQWERFAHSYVGFGLTPAVGKELTKRKLNALNEKWHTLYHLLKFKHIDLTQGGVLKRYSSLVFSTINRMSKIVKLEQNARSDDGLMEIYEMEYRSPLQVMKSLLSASFWGIPKTERTDSYEIRTLKKTLVQLDGEVFTLDADSDVVVTCEKQRLRTVI